MKAFKTWSDREKARLTEMWPECTVGEIAGALGRSRGGVRKMASDLGLDRKVVRTEMPEATKAAIRDLWLRLDITVDDIARQVGATKGQVTGLAYRERLPMRRKPMDLRPGHGPRPKQPWHHSVRSLGDDTGYRARRCQYIEGSVPTRPEDIEGVKCGERVVEGRPYCADHLARCYRGEADDDEVAA